MPSLDTDKVSDLEDRGIDANPDVRYTEHAPETG